MQAHLPEQNESADLAACADLLRDGSRTFHAASLVLPKRVREPAIALYAFCRLADDAIDLQDDKAAALARLRERLAGIYAGLPQVEAADRALARVLERFAIPRALPEALLEGFKWDAEVRRYETIDDLHAYAARVAGSVGAMMSILMGARAPLVVARACDLGIAMQLTNIARDVGEDARAGRLYLPLHWMREQGIDPQAWLRQPVFSAALGTVIQRVLRDADLLYRRASGGIARLPVDCRPGMHAARLLYSEIGREVERRGLDSVAGRAVVATPRKSWLALRSVAAAALAKPSTETPVVLEAARFLVEAVAAQPEGLAIAAARRPRLARLDERAIWLIDLFDRLERRQRTLSVNARAAVLTRYEQ